jgi:hypothetical protein
VTFFTLCPSSFFLLQQGQNGRNIFLELHPGAASAAYISIGLMQFDYSSSTSVKGTLRIATRILLMRN